MCGRIDGSPWQAWCSGRSRSVERHNRGKDKCSRAVSSHRGPPVTVRGPFVTVKHRSRGGDEDPGASPVVETCHGNKRCDVAAPERQDSRAVCAGHARPRAASAGMPGAWGRRPGGLGWRHPKPRVGTSGTRQEARASARSPVRRAGQLRDGIQVALGPRERALDARAPVTAAPRRRARRGDRSMARRPARAARKPPGASAAARSTRALASLHGWPRSSETGWPRWPRVGDRARAEQRSGRGGRRPDLDGCCRAA